ncbi:WSC domain-containing protein [Mameliella alba]|nr:WSC domain-containing protein [Mameliella alba]MBY6170726.1 WSC domain-containing protein [Mameliella alba]MBY6175744.1 WSC domain-containing protein [Mameliella alba]
MRHLRSFALTLWVIGALPLMAVADMTGTADNGRRVLLRDNGTWSYLTGGALGDPAYCTEYAGAAVWQQQQNLTVPCGQSGPDWHLDRDRHFAWCMAAAPGQAQAARQARFDVLTRCKSPSDAKYQQCQTYADHAMSQVRRNKDWNCGIDPNGTNPQWSLTRAFHVDWCVKSTDAARAKIVQMRADALAANCRPPAPKVTYLGCFKDTGNRDLTGAFMASAEMTPALCFQFCRDKGFAIAGLQYGQQCFCGNQIGQYGRAEMSKCEMPCPGNPKQMCGGFWTNSAFRLDGAVP